MNRALSGGDIVGSFRCRPTSMMLIRRVPGGTRSGRARRAGVFGNANPAPLISPPPGPPTFPGGPRGEETPAEPAAAVLFALEPVADGDHRGVDRPVPLGELAHEQLVDTAEPRRVIQGVGARRGHVVLKAL